MKNPHSSCSGHRQHFGGPELCLQIQPSLMVRSDIQRTSPCKGRLVRADYWTSSNHERPMTAGRADRHARCAVWKTEASCRN
jgi:hypothetical protein